jgi:hypothetical protein
MNVFGLKTAIGTNSPFLWVGRASRLCPGNSDVDFFCDLKRVVDLDAEITNRAFNPAGMVSSMVGLLG